MARLPYEMIICLMPSQPMHEAGRLHLVVQFFDGFLVFLVLFFRAESFHFFTPFPAALIAFCLLK